MGGVVNAMFMAEAANKRAREREHREKRERMRSGGLS